MPRERIELQKILEEILESRNVYFQPPESLKIKYPCVIYELSDEWVNSADDIDYSEYDVYSLTLIDKNPETKFRKSIRNLEHCSFDRSFTSDGLNHFVYRLYF